MVKVDAALLLDRCCVVESASSIEQPIKVISSQFLWWIAA